MIRKECNKFSDICDSMSDWYKPLAWVLLFFGSAACTEGPIVPEPEPEPSGFTIHMDEENIVEYQEDEQGIYPHLYTAYLVMENLPADEKILYMGGCYSNGSTEPDLSDYTLIYDYSEHDTFQQWDWESGPLIWNCLALYHLMPGTTYHIRGYVKTDKAEYFSNTMEVRSNFTAPMEETTDAYTIPVIFHLFPDDDGSYPVKEWMLKEQLDYANRVYSNYFGIPGQEDTGVRFAPATHAPDGKPLSTPGMIYEKEPVEIDSANAELEDRYVWDMEHALNVWVCPITNVYEDEYSIFAGFSYFPFFDENELLPGCDIYKPGLATGIFLNKQAVLTANSISTFAHEAGHFLGLAHVFGQGGDQFQAYRCQRHPVLFRQHHGLQLQFPDRHHARPNPAHPIYPAARLLHSGKSRKGRTRNTHLREVQKVWEESGSINRRTYCERENNHFQHQVPQHYKVILPI